MQKKWVFWLVFSVVVTILVFTVFLLLIKGIRKSRRVDEVTANRPQINYSKRNISFSETLPPIKSDPKHNSMCVSFIENSKIRKITEERSDKKDIVLDNKKDSIY